MVQGDKGSEAEPFSDPLYLASATLDPMFGLRWLDCAMLDEESLESTKDYIRATILRECESKNMHNNLICHLAVYIYSLYTHSLYKTGLWNY